MTPNRVNHFVQWLCFFKKVNSLKEVQKKNKPQQDEKEPLPKFLPNA
jgi:hypothetical protein